jgi:hypothetical protein
MGDAAFAARRVKICNKADPATSRAREVGLIP